MYSLQTRLRRHMCTHMLVLYINWLMASETRPRRNFSQLSVSWVNLFGRSWIWQSSSSAANNTETNENISSTPFLSCLLCTLALSRSLLSLALCLDLSLSLSHAHSTSSSPCYSLTAFSFAPLLSWPSWTSSLFTCTDGFSDSSES